MVDSVPGLSRFTEVVLHQGRMERFFLDAIRASYPVSGNPRTTDPSMGAGGGKGAEQDPRPIRVERCVIPTSLAVDEDTAADEDEYPVTVKLRHLSEDEATPVQALSNLSDGMFRSNLADDDVDDILTRSAARGGQEEILKCKYVIGCDGAHSWTRKALGKGFEMVGEMTDYIW